MHQAARSIGLSYEYKDFFIKYTLTFQLIIIQRVGLDTMQAVTRNALIYCFNEYSFLYARTQLCFFWDCTCKI
jgi:hypothetical protein